MSLTNETEVTRAAEDSAARDLTPVAEGRKRAQRPVNASEMRVLQQDRDEPAGGRAPDSMAVPPEEAGVAAVPSRRMWGMSVPQGKGSRDVGIC